MKSEYEEGYSNDLTEFVVGAHFFRGSSFRKASPTSLNQTGRQTHGWILFNFLSIISVFSLLFAELVVLTVNGFL